MKLTDEQEKAVLNFVDKQQLQIKSLYDDLTDHLCCAIEFELQKGKDFNQALLDATAELAPNGLIEIEKQTFYLLNYNRLIIMKKVMYLIGFLGSVSFIGGLTFKLLNFQGGNELFMAGYLTILLIFIPLYVIDQYKGITKSPSEKMKIILGLLAAVLSGLAGLFKIFHLQGADLLLLAGAAVFILGFLPFLFFRMYKKSISQS